MSRTQSLITLGRLAVQLGLTPDRAMGLARKLDIVPALRINGVVHFDDDDAQRIIDHRQQIKLGTTNYDRNT